VEEREKSRKALETKVTRRADACEEKHKRQSEEWNTEHEGLKSDERKIQEKCADRVARTQQEKVQARGIINTKADEMVLEWKGRRVNELVNLETKTRLRREEL